MEKTFENVSGEFLITTIDNPYDPFTEPDEWYQYDTVNGYNTNAMTARFADLSSELTEAEKMENFKNAMIEVVRVNPIYIKIRKNENNKEILRKLRAAYLETTSE